MGGSGGRVADRCLRHYAAGKSTAAMTTASGVATKTLTVGPLTEGQVVTINACLNGTSQCVTLYRYWRAPRVCVAQRRVRYGASQPGRGGNAQPDHAAGAGYGRQPYGRRHGDALPGALRVDSALRAAWVNARRRRCWLHRRPRGYIRTRWNGDVHACFAAGRGHQSAAGLAVTGNTATVGIAVEQHP